MRQKTIDYIKNKYMVRDYSTGGANVSTGKFW